MTDETPQFVINEVPPQLMATVSKRGLRYMPPLPIVGGGVVRVHESSNVTRPCVWLNVKIPRYNEPRMGDTNLAVEIHVDDALWLAEQLWNLASSHQLRTDDC